MAKRYDVKRANDLSRGYYETVILRQREEDRRWAEADLKAFDEEQASERQQLTRQQTPTATQPKPKKEGSSGDPNFWSEAGTAVVGGIRDTIQGLGDNLKLCVKWMYENPELPNPTTGFMNNPLLTAAKKIPPVKEALDRIVKPHLNTMEKAELPNIENKTLGGNIGRNVVSFLSLLIPGNAVASGAVKGAGITSKLGTWGIKALPGIFADFTLDSPEGRLSNLIEEVPALSNPVTGFLQAKPDDTEWESKIKSTLEGFSVGLLFEPFMAGLKYIKGRRELAKVAGEDAIKALDSKLSGLLDVANDADSVVNGHVNTDGITRSLDEVLGDAETRLGTKPNSVAPDGDIQFRISTTHSRIDDAGEYLLKELESKPDRYVPEDTMLRSPEEIEDIRRYAMSKGPDAITEFLEAVDNHRTVDNIISGGNPEDIVDYLSAIKPQGTVDPTTEALTRIGLKGSTSPFRNMLAGAFYPAAGNQIDFNNDGKTDWVDTAIGVVALGGIGAIGYKILAKEGPEAAYKAISSEKITKLLQAKDTLTTALEKAPDNVKFKEALTSVNEILGQLEKFKDLKTLRKSIKNPQALEAFDNSLKPLVKVRPEAVESFSKDIADGNFVNLLTHLEVDFDRIGAPEEIDALQEIMVDRFDKEIVAAKGGVNHWDQTIEAATKELSKTTGYSVEYINKVFKNKTQNLAAHILASRTILKASENKLLELQTKILDGVNDTETLLAFKKQLTMHSGILSQVEGIKAETGRALNALKIMPSSTRKFSADQLENILEELGGTGNIKNAAKMLQDLEEGAVRSNFIKRLGKSTRFNFLWEMYYGALLSNPGTWIINGLSGVFTTTAALAETGTASLFNMGNPRGTHFGESFAMIQGIVEGFGDALRLAGKTFREEAPTELMEGHNALSLTKEGSIYRTITGDLVSPDTALGKWLDDAGVRETVAGALDYLGQGIRFGSRVLMTEDQFWKVIDHRMVLRQQIYREAFEKATVEGIEGKAFKDFIGEYVEELLSNTPEEIYQKAVDAANYNTFNSVLTSNIGKGIQSAAQNPIIKLILPFVRTPYNISKYVADRTPVVNMITKKGREALFGGSLVQKQEWAARTALGGLTLAVGFNLASQGVITGSGGNERSAKMMDGWMPYSIKVGDTYIQYNRLDPVASFLGIAADLHDILTNVEDEETTITRAAWASIASISNNLMSKQYLQGISSIIDAIQDPDPDKAGFLIKRQLGSFVPSVVGNIEKAIDPTVNETYELFDGIKARLPGASGSLYPKRDLFGEPITQGGSPWNLINPFTYSKESGDPARAAIAEYGFSPKTILSSMRKIDGIKLSPQQYDRYVEVMGKLLKEDLDQLVNSPGFQAPNESDADKSFKRQMIQSAITNARTLASFKVLEEFPELQEDTFKRREWNIMNYVEK